MGIGLCGDIAKGRDRMETYTCFPSNPLKCKSHWKQEARKRWEDGAWRSDGMVERCERGGEVGGITRGVSILHPPICRRNVFMDCISLLLVLSIQQAITEGLNTQSTARVEGLMSRSGPTTMGTYYSQ